MWPSGPKARTSEIPTQVLFTPILSFVGLEESAAQTAGQFGSPQGSLGKLLRCQPCPEGCTSCLDATPCLVEEALALRKAVLACQACCMLAVFLSMLVAYRCRRSKARRPPSLFYAHVQPMSNKAPSLGRMGANLASTPECVTVRQ